MEIDDYLQVLRRRWRTVATFVVVLLAVAVVITIQATPQYSSSARLFVSTVQTDTTDAYEGSLFSAARVASYADLVTGEELSRRVIDELGIDMSPSELSGKIEATVVPETVIMDITVTDPNPEQAQLLAQTVAEELAVFVAELETPPTRSVAPIKATVVDPASVPGDPVSPQPGRNLGLAVVLGLTLGFGLAMLREVLDKSVKSAADVAEVSDTSVLASVGFDPEAGRKPLVTALAPHNPRAEALRVLRTNLQFVDVDTPGTKVFVITSSVPEEGKSATASNLAITLAQAGQKVLLVEADLRRPKLSHMLEWIEAGVGVSTVLAGRVSLEDAVQVYTPVPRLHVLASGTIPPNPAELLQSRAMADLLERARSKYDVVIVDAPPLLPVTDAAVLAAQADGALVVLRCGKTTKEQLRHSIERLDAVKGRMVGVVLNMVPRTGGSGYRRAYGEGYDYAALGLEESPTEVEPPSRPDRQPAGRR